MCSRSHHVANFWEAVYKEIVTDCAMTAEEKAQGHIDTPE